MIFIKFLHPTYYVYVFYTEFKVENKDWGIRGPTGSRSYDLDGVSIRFEFPGYVSATSIHVPSKKAIPKSISIYVSISSFIPLFTYFCHTNICNFKKTYILTPLICPKFYLDSLRNSICWAEPVYENWISPKG